MYEFRFEKRFDRPVEKVFARMTDHARMSDWLEGTQVSLEVQGVPPPNGLGAIRKLNASGVKSREKIVRWEPPNAVDYRVIEGAPVRNHLGEVRFEPTADGGTQLRYRITFEVPWYYGGPLLVALVKGIVSRGLRKSLDNLADLVRRENP